jgi:hypothetical protein
MSPVDNKQRFEQAARLFCVDFSEMPTRRLNYLLRHAAENKFLIPGSKQNRQLLNPPRPQAVDLSEAQAARNFRGLFRASGKFHPDEFDCRRYFLL